MDLIQLIVDPTFDAIVIGLVTVIAGTLVTDKYESYRSRAIVEIAPISFGNKLGFELKIRRKTLNHPRILFFAGFTRTVWRDLHECDLWDEENNPYKQDYVIAGGRPIRIYPLVCVPEWKKYGDSYNLTVRVINSKTKREAHSMYIENVPMIGNVVFGYPKEPKPSDDWQASIQVIAEGLEREVMQRFNLGLEVDISRFGATDPPEKTLLWFTLHAKRESLLWRTI